MKKFCRFFPVILWAALLVPLFLGARAAHPATDDFTFALYTHPTWMETGSLPHVIKDAVSYALRTWRDWQGTITGVIIMTLNPIVFSLKHYGVHALILLAAHLAAWFAFIRHFFGRRLGLSASVWGGLYLALSAISLMFMPDIVEGIYWFNGAWFYTGAQAAALITLVLCDRFAQSSAAGAKRALHALVCAGLLFALGMDNYITAMMTAAALFMMALQRAWARDRHAAIRTALLLLPIGAGLLISVIAPGNSVRMERDGAHVSGMGWMLSSIGWTLRDAAKYFVRFALKTPLLAIVIGATPLLAKQTADEPERARRCPPVWISALAAYLILCAMIIPHMYSSGYAGSGRVVNMYHLYVLLAVPLVWTLALVRMQPKTREQLASARAKKACAVLAAAALALCLALGQAGNYVKLIADQLDGTQEAYIAQFENEYALCAAGGEEDEVVLPAWQVQTVTGKSTAFEDASMWTNEAMAQYFGVRSVRVGK